ncbi:Ig-like domain-containing protein [Bacillus sp. NP157]|nr:Ig-like domain-containing protein [Bacillus sp. NP157]
MIITDIDDGGLGHFDLIADPYARVAMVMGPLSLDELAPGDMLRAFMNVGGEEKQIASHVIQPGDLPESRQGSPVFTLEANASEINRYPDGEYDFSYDVLYTNGKSDGSIEPLRVRIKRTIPGDPDDPSATVNEGLALAEVVPSPVQSSASSVTVTIPAWTNMAEGDVPTVDWERLHLTLPAVNTGGVGRPVSVTLTRDQLEEVGGMQDLPVSYEIFDVVSNHSGHSRFTLVDVEIEPPGALTAPRIREAVDGVIDPRQQGTDPFTIQIPAIGSRQGREARDIAPGDRITATFEGRIPGTGASHQWVSPPLIVPNPIFNLTIALPVDEVAPLAGGTARVSYTVLPVGGGPALPSRHLGIAVAGVPELLPAVTIPEDANGDDVLDPLTEIAEGATAVIDYPNMALDDYITLDLLGRRANGMADNDRKYRQVSHLGPQSLTISTDYLTRLDGGTLELKYTADSFDGIAGVLALRESESRTVIIGSQPEEPKLPAPAVAGVVDGLLPPSTRQSEVVVPRSVLQVGDGVDYTWRSAVSDGAHLTVRNLNDDLRFDVDGELIKANDGSDVAVGYTRTRDGTVARSDETVFTIAAAALLPAPTVKEAVADQLDPGAVADAGGATVLITADLKQGDEIVVHFGTWDSAPVAWTQMLAVIVPPGAVAQYLGEAIDVLYTVNGKASSLPLRLYVLAFRDADARLPKPTIKEANDGVIDLTSFSGDATVIVAPWQLMAERQKAWLYIEGRAPDGATSKLDLLDAIDMSRDDLVNGLTREVDRGWLERLSEGSTVTPVLLVTFNRSPEVADAVRFPANDYQLVLYTDFFIDPSAVTLRIGQQMTRAASGGAPPYSYASENPNVASVVNPSTGIVRGIDVGTTTIVATDAARHRATYPASVTGAIVITPPSPTMHVGDRVTFTCSGGYPPYRWVIPDIDRSSLRIASASGNTAVVEAIGTLPPPPLKVVQVFDSHGTQGDAGPHVYP